MPFGWKKMESVVWFVAGSIGATIGSAGGLAFNRWTVWVGSLVGGVIVVAISRRWSAVVGASCVAAFFGAAAVQSAGWAAFLAAVSTLLNAFVVFSEVFSFRSRGTSRSASPSFLRRPSASLKPREFDLLLRLAEEDTALFQQRLQQLSAEQRDQIRAALRERGRKGTSSFASK